MKRDISSGNRIYYYNNSIICNRPKTIITHSLKFKLCFIKLYVGTSYSIQHLYYYYTFILLNGLDVKPAGLTT